MKHKAELKNWFFTNERLVGDVYGHPMFPDGSSIRTSELKKFNRDTGEAETKNTLYKLRDERKDYNKNEELN